MGQIVIDIPTRGKRRYVVSDKGKLAELIVSLENSAVRVKNVPLTLEEMEYEEDVRDVERAVAEYKRTGKTYRWEDVEAEIGL